jgi:DNA-directed RNA polymerase specialized sigma24 family protein
VTTGRPDLDAVRFTALWEAHAGRVLAYARRHVGPDDAHEVVSETFLVAWRRLADVPGTALPWLLVVARNTVANHRRSGYRRALLDGELARLQEVAQVADCSVSAFHVRLFRARRRLRATDDRQDAAASADTPSLTPTPDRSTR